MFYPKQSMQCFLMIYVIYIHSLIKHLERNQVYRIFAHLHEEDGPVCSCKLKWPMTWNMVFSSVSSSLMYQLIMLGLGCPPSQWQMKLRIGIFQCHVRNSGVYQKCKKILGVTTGKGDLEFFTDLKRQNFKEGFTFQWSKTLQVILGSEDCRT